MQIFATGLPGNAGIDGVAILDPAALAGLRALQDEDSPHFLADLIALFVADTDSRLLSLRDAITRGHAEVIAREAHALKGSCASVGAQRMAALCQTLQSVARTGDLGEVPYIVDHLVEEYRRTRAALYADLARG